MTEPGSASGPGGVGAGRPKRLLTRRRVLLGLGGVAGAGVLGTGGFLLTDRYRRFVRRADHRIPDHRVDLPASVPRIVIARGVDPARNVRAAVERLGGMARFVGPGDVVVVKPNVGWERTPEQGANTHPEVVAEVVRLCREARASRVVVSDCPVRRSRGAFERSGILVAASAAGAEVVLPEESRYVPVEVSKRLGTWDVLEPFVVATKLINVPVAKHHDLTGVTCGLKNWIGITGKLRVMFHDDIQRSIAELAALMRPTLTVVDASRVLMHHGPVGGSLDDVKPVRAVAAGLDPVALDAWACSLFAGQPLPGNLHLAASMGLGQVDFTALGPVEVLAG
ncbi:DUF362 domain-containing protein [Acidobacteria bacterium ACD]|nr:MAG: DUF362 domain-containing protein [Acidobacteriota bacterium]MCE7956526.1 DUF362 domain-containing protein [Acidobacteria bacterium ACB2]MDL1948820.1 DUF362 domain-containing protein [Acidobacteria bacterium ACD]